MVREKVRAPLTKIRHGLGHSMRMTGKPMWLALCLLLMTVVLIAFSSRAAEVVPFWKGKPELLKKIREERAIVVSVRNREISHEPKKILFTMQGVGVASRPKEVAFRLSQQYHLLPKVSEHFRTVSFDAEKKELFLVTEALGYQARMLLKIEPTTQAKRDELKWEVIWGHFKGMKGVIGFEPAGPGEDARTEVSFQAAYEAEELPLPKALMGFALEVVTQKVAEKMRSFIEDQPLSVLDQPAPLKKPSAFMWPTLDQPVSPMLEKVPSPKPAPDKPGR